MVYVFPGDFSSSGWLLFPPLAPYALSPYTDREAARAGMPVGWHVGATAGRELTTGARGAGEDSSCKGRDNMRVSEEEHEGLGGAAAARGVTAAGCNRSIAGE